MNKKIRSVEELAKSASIGYGHYLRRQNAQDKLDIQKWKNDIKSLQNKIKDKEWLINLHSESLEVREAELKIIDEHHKHLEPDWGYKTQQP